VIQPYRKPNAKQCPQYRRCGVCKRALVFKSTQPAVSVTAGCLVDRVRPRKQRSRRRNQIKYGDTSSCSSAYIQSGKSRRTHRDVQAVKWNSEINPLPSGCASLNNGMITSCCNAAKHRKQSGSQTSGIWVSAQIGSDCNVPGLVLGYNYDTRRNVQAQIGTHVCQS
jgi:hypothetical protein